jgi:hypothetical protein
MGTPAEMKCSQDSDNPQMTILENILVLSYMSFCPHIQPHMAFVSLGKQDACFVQH